MAQAGSASNCNCTLPSRPVPRIQRAAGHELAARDQVGRQSNLEHRGRTHAEARGVDRRAARVLAERARVEADRGLVRISRVRSPARLQALSSRTALDERAAQRGELAVQAGRRDCLSPRAGPT